MLRRNGGLPQRTATTPDHRNLSTLATRKVPVTKHPTVHPVIGVETFASLLARLRRDDQVDATLVNGGSLRGRVDLVSLNGDVLWVHTGNGRRMLFNLDVANLVRVKPDPTLSLPLRG